MITRQKWVGSIVMLAALLFASAGVGHAWGGGRGFGGHEFHHGFHGGFHRFGGPRIGIGIGLGPFWGPYWGPYAYPYAYPPVVAVPSTQVYVQPSAPATAQPPPSAFWYYCNNPRGYYPYVQQCPGGWRAVAPTPP
jgi:hypothetical protein